MSTLFEKIIAGEIPSYKVHESECSYAFLTIEPCAPGHTLVVPKVAVDKWTDLSREELVSLTLDAQLIAQKLEIIYNVPRVGVIIAGFMVPHVHIHLIPCHSESELRLENASKKTSEELEKEHIKILSAW